MAAIVKKFSLNNEQQEVLKALTRQKAMSPARVSAETMMLPGATMGVLRDLVDAGLVLITRDDTSPDGKVVILTEQGYEAFTQSMLGQS